jgi:uncharacterized protein (TIGR02466 family)
MNKNIYEIFNYQVFCTKLNLNLNLLKKYCFQLQKNNKGRAKSNVGGWQSEDLFDEHPIIIQLKNNIVKHINNFSKEFNFNKKLKLSNLWVNINGYKDSNEIHTHPSSFFSGVFYVKAPKKSGKLTFLNPNRNFMEWVFDKNVTSYIQNNSSIWSFEPEENMLYIFPSFLEHKVTPHINKTEKRISISFNSEL